MKLQRLVYEALEERKTLNQVTILTQSVLGVLILGSTVLSIWETVPDNSVDTNRMFQAVQNFCGGAFLLEYLLRLWVAPLRNNKENVWVQRLKMIFRPTMIIDLMVVLPFILPYFFGFDATSLRVFTLIRNLRLA